VNWGQTKGEFFFEPTNLFFDNLVNSYWSSLLTELTDVDSRLITCQMFLTPNDINNFQFYKQVFLTIDGVDGYYKVNSIENYTPGRNSLCKVTLLKSRNSLVSKKYTGSISTTRPIGSTGSGSGISGGASSAASFTSGGSSGFAGFMMPMSVVTAGFDNTITESASMAIGSGNTIDTTNAFTLGNSNYITQTDGSVNVIGDNNSVNNNSNSLVAGSNNNLFSGDVNLISGNNNNVSGNNVNVLGSNTNASGDNMFIIGNNITSTASNQMIIDPNIAVQPANLIQDYTPTSAQDTTYPVGAITKNDNDIWVRTSGLGWRQIPFNNSFGNFYDTTTQTNPTASTANAFTFNSVAQSNYINVIDNSKITVDFDGLYNIQFSAQVDKTDSGSDDIDIWLRYNGVNVDWSNTKLTLPGNNAKLVAAWNLVQPMTASSYIELMWSSADTAMRIFAQGTQSTPLRPGIPSIILTIDKISSL
jgi:hypothetical protein